MLQTCTRCKRPKESSCFRIRHNKNDKNHDGKPHPWCVACENEDQKFRQRQKRKEDPDRFRNYDLKKNYGITLEDKRRMFMEQGKRCAACGSFEGRSNRYKGDDGWCIDHDHDTGSVRGILCSSCNTALGYVEDSIPYLKGLIAYLEKFEDKAA